jgi:hypothetical protein
LLKHTRILCWVMLDTNNLMEKFEYLVSHYLDSPTMMSAKEAIVHTWGKRCSWLVIFSGERAVDSERVPTVPLNTTTDTTSWAAYREAALYLRQYTERFDWFLLVEEDSFVVLENLAYFLAVYKPATPHYFGHAYRTWSTEYARAGAGVVLSRAAMTQLLGYLGAGHWAASFLSGEVALGQCLRDLNIHITDTRDELSRERFLPFQPETMLLDTFVWSGFFSGSSKYTLPKVSMRLR